MYVFKIIWFNKFEIVIFWKPTHKEKMCNQDSCNKRENILEI